MGWTYLGLSLLGLLHAVNAERPSRHPWLLGQSFFGSWLTIELVWHHLVIGVVLTAGFVSAGVLDTVPGMAGLGVMVITELALLRIALMSRKTVVIVRGALEELEPGSDAPRFPRRFVVLPFLMGRRKENKHQRNVPFRRVAGKTLKLDVTIPTVPAPGGGPLRPALLQIHGGGWVIGDKREQGIPLLEHMAALGWVGFNANYRLSPGATFPDHLEDITAALAWVREHAAEYDVDPSFVCVTGGSAGGHLSSLLALTAEPRVAGAVPFYGIYDFTPDGEFGKTPRIYPLFVEPWVMKAFVDEEPEKFRAASPIHRIPADPPPFFIVHGDRDTLAPVEDAREFAAALKAVSRQPVAYAEMQGAQHAFEIFPSARSARVVEGVERFLSTLWDRREAPRAQVEAELADTLTD